MTNAASSGSSFNHNFIQLWHVKAKSMQHCVGIYNVCDVLTRCHGDIYGCLENENFVNQKKRTENKNSVQIS